MLEKIKNLYVLPVVISLLILLPNIAVAQSPLKMGAFIPFSGRWGDSGRECAKGILDASKWINQRGGVFGRKLEIIMIDDQSQVGETLAAFRKLNEADRVLLFYIHSMDTALSLTPHIHYHHIPAMVSSMPASFAPSAKYPYIFSTTPTPLDAARIAMNFISENPGPKTKKPKVVFLGFPDHLSRDFLDGIKKYGTALGLNIGMDITISDPATSKGILSALTTLASNNPDFVYLSLTSTEASSILQEAAKMGLKTKWVCSPKAFDENLTSFEGVMGVQPISPFGEDVPGMADLKDAHQRWHPYDSHTLSYVEGWATVRIIAEAFGRSLPEERLSRDRVKSALEGFRNFVMGGLIPPVTITAIDHRPSVESRVFMIKEGKLLRQSGFISVGR